MDNYDEYFIVIDFDEFASAIGDAIYVPITDGEINYLRSEVSTEYDISRDDIEVNRLNIVAANGRVIRVYQKNDEYFYALHRLGINYCFYKCSQRDGLATWLTWLLQ